MNCNEWRELASALIDDEVEDSLLPPLFKHLGTCSGCISFSVRARRLQAVAADLRDAGASSLSSSTTGTGHRSMHRVSFSLPTVALAAMLLVALTLAFSLNIVGDRRSIAREQSELNRLYESTYPVFTEWEKPR